MQIAGRIFDLAGKARLIYPRNGPWLPFERGFSASEQLPNRSYRAILDSHLRKRERITKNETEIIHQLHRPHLGPNPPQE